FVAPPDLEAELTARGYQPFQPTLVQTLQLQRPPDVACPPDVEFAVASVPEFVAAVGEMQAATAEQRAAHLERLATAALLTWAWERGAHTAYLQVAEDNHRARSMYRRLGFATAYTYHYRGRPGEDH
ncbi:MAG: GNAT family N-acetyltransferase, partial [Betaproteobacteria bacterium]|nr:GNAT family N-acetyltransferase [Betaproteobacteria bacterium]